MASIALWEAWISNRTTMIAPQLIHYELTNSTFRFSNHLRLAPEHAQSLIDEALVLPIDLHREEELHPRALKLGRQFGLKAANDAHYPALAEAVSCPIYICDARLYRAVLDQFPHSHLVD